MSSINRPLFNPAATQPGIISRDFAGNTNRKPEKVLQVLYFRETEDSTGETKSHRY